MTHPIAVYAGAAPDWARFLTVAADGTVAAWEHAPRMTAAGWWSLTGRRETLRSPRPSEPICFAIESATVATTAG